MRRAFAFLLSDTRVYTPPGNLPRPLQGFYHRPVAIFLSERRTRNLAAWSGLYYRNAECRTPLGCGGFTCADGFSTMLDGRCYNRRIVQPAPSKKEGQRMGRRVSAMAALLVSCLGMSSLVLASSALDGKTFSGVVGQKGKTDTRPDDFVFQGGQFESTLCTTFGYGKGDYQAKADGAAVEFTAETTNTDGGTMQWKGTVKGNDVEGTALSMEKGRTSESWFKGALKKTN